MISHSNLHIFDGHFPHRGLVPRHWWLLHQGTDAWARRLWHGLPGADFPWDFPDFPLNPVVGQRSLLEFPKNVVCFAQLSTRCIRTMWLGEDFPWHGLSDFRVSARPPPRSGPSKHSPLSKRGRDTPWNAWSCPCAMPRLKWSRRVTGYWAWRGHQRGCSQQTHNKGFETWCLQNWYSLNMWIFWYFEHRGTQFLGSYFEPQSSFETALRSRRGLFRVQPVSFKLSWRLTPRHLSSNQFFWHTHMFFSLLVVIVYTYIYNI